MLRGQIRWLLRFDGRHSGVVARPTSAVLHPVLRWVPLTSHALTALLDRNLSAASAHAGVKLTDHFIADKALRLWQRRLAQIASDPASGQWIARAALPEPLGVVVGHAGYHGPPDDNGMVEIAYSVDPTYRRQGFARAMLRDLLQRARNEPSVATVRATISPDNAASLATLQGFGFTHLGEQWDDEDGLELIFEVSAR